MRKLGVRLVLIVAVSAAAAHAQQPFEATLQGGFAVPPTASNAGGEATFLLDESQVLNYEITLEGLSAAEMSSHIGGPAQVGSVGAVQFELPLGAYKQGSVGPLSALQVAQLNTSLFYVNVRTSAFPAGEIRGQIKIIVSVDDGTWGRIKSLYRR